MDGWQQAPEPPAWHEQPGVADRDATVTDGPSRLPATLSIIAIVVIVGAVIAIALLHGGGEPGIAVPAPARATTSTTTSAPPETDSVEIDNPDARLSYRVPKTWTPDPDAAPEVLGVRFTGAASYAPYPCGGSEYSRAFAVSAAVRSTAGKDLDPRETAQRFGAEFAVRFFGSATPGTPDAGESEVDGKPAVLVTVPVAIAADDPKCQATAGLVTVLAIDLGDKGLVLLVIVTDTAGGPDEPVPPSEDDLRAIIASARVS